MEYEERASSETLAVPIEGMDEKSFGELSRIDKALRKIKQQRLRHLRIVRPEEGEGSCGRQMDAVVKLIPEK